jgi:hypothetical protein
MKSAAAVLAPQMIQWSPQSVRALDMATRAVSYASGIAEFGSAIQNGREVIVAVSQRSAFIRSVSVPNVGKDEVAKVLRLKLGPVLPLNPTEYVFGFRLANDAKTGAKTAVVGAVKLDAVRRIQREAKEQGLRVRSVVPLAFGSWLAAKAHSLTDCAVVQAGNETLTIDLVEGGELRYSRSVPLPETSGEILDEISRTFRVAEIKPSRVLALASREVEADLHDAREALEYLADAHAIERSLFTLELPEVTAARESKAKGRSMYLALTALAFAATLGGISGQRYSHDLASQADLKAKTLKQLSVATAARTAADLAEKQSAAMKSIVDTAFKPKQRFTDVITELGLPLGKDTWLTGISLERGKPIVLRGISIDGKSVAAYAADLNKNPRLRGMKVSFANSSMIEKKPVVQFSITGHVVGNFPIDIERKAGGPHS